MRATTLLRKCLELPRTVFESVQVCDDGNLELSVRPRQAALRCGSCGQRAAGYDQRPTRRWRHLALGKTVVYLSYAPRRVACRACQAVRNEQVPWGPSAGSFTWAFEELTAYLAQQMPQSRAAEMQGVAWRTVDGIVHRVVTRKLDPQRFASLRRIGVDEFSYRKRHRYLTVVVDHDTRRVVWAGEGRSAETLQRFFDRIGEEACAEIETVTIDMAGGYIKAIRESLPNAQIVFDRFHVQQLASRAVDDVRRRLVRTLGGRSEARRVKGLRFLLLRHGLGLEIEALDRLQALRRTHSQLYRSYLRKEELTAIFDETDPDLAERYLMRWLASAARSRIPEIVRVGRTLRRHWHGVIAYFRQRLSNGLVEGFNNKLRVVARRAYGYHSPEALAAMLFLVSGGIELDPPLPNPN